jgi:hypothetical protein
VDFQNGSSCTSYHAYEPFFKGGGADGIEPA